MSNRLDPGLQAWEIRKLEDMLRRGYRLERIARELPDRRVEDLEGHLKVLLTIRQRATRDAENAVKRQRRAEACARRPAQGVRCDDERSYRPRQADDRALARLGAPRNAKVKPGTGIGTVHHGV